MMRRTVRPRVREVAPPARGRPAQDGKLQRAKALGDCPLVAAVDVDLARARQLAGPFPGCIAGATWEPVIARDDIDLVIVATTNDMLAPVTLAAVNAGKHVLVEKPMALDAASVRVAGLLKEHGLARGDRVGVMLPNVPYFAVVYYGVLRAGGAVVPMNVLLKGLEVAFYPKDLQAKVLFAWHDFADAAEDDELPVGLEVAGVAGSQPAIPSNSSHTSSASATPTRIGSSQNASSIHCATRWRALECRT